MDHSVVDSTILILLLIYVTRLKNCMERIRLTSFIVLSTVLALVIQLLIINSVLAQAPNTSLAHNPNITRIIDLKNHTITILDLKTNQLVSVCKFTPIEAANTTTNNTLTTNVGNVTTCENLTPGKPTINETLTTNAGNATTSQNLTSGKPTINETLTTNAGNATTSVNLTTKFNALQGK
jgi:hypothetical protein